MRRSIAWIIGLVALAGLVYAASPLVSAWMLREAALRKDAAGVSRFVDYPALRASLKSELGAALAHSPRIADPGGPKIDLNRIINTALISPIVDWLVTPDGLAAMFSGQLPLPNLKAQPGSSRISLGLEGLNKIILKSQPIQNPKREVHLVFVSHGLVWKLSEVRLPGGLFGDAPAPPETPQPPERPELPERAP